jgi:DNA-3-methyladenine glycosylase II
VSTIQVPPPYDFGLYPKLFIHEEGAFLPFRYSPTRWSRLINADDDLVVPVSVTCEYTPDPRLSLLFPSGVSDKQLKRIEGKIASAFCANVDLEPLYDRASGNARLRQLIEELNGLRPHLSLDPFESLIKVIVRQVVRATTAQRLIDNLVRKFGTSLNVDGDTYFSFPTPKALAFAKKVELLDCRIGYKWKVIREVSREVVSGSLDFEELQTLDDDTVVDILTEFKWIGPWTSRVFLYDGLHRLDAYPEFDISIKRAAELLRLRTIVKEHGRDGLSGLRSVWGVMVSYLFGSLWINNLSEQADAPRSEYK